MSLILPPLSPGWKKYPNSGIIVVAAGQFLGAARAGLSAVTDPDAPGPSQAQDDQTAANGTAALDTVVIDLDTVGVDTNVRYKVMVGYHVADTGSAAFHLASVDHAGTVREADSGDGGQIMFVTASTYAAIEPTGVDNGIVLATGAGQTLKLRAFLESGSGAASLDCVFLLPNPITFPFSAWANAGGGLNYDNYTTVFDGWVPPGYGGVSPPFGYNGMFPNANATGQVADSNGVTSAPDPNSFAPNGNNFDLAGVGAPAEPQTIRVTARCTDPTKGVGKLRAVIWNGSSFDPGPGGAYDVPADGSVYLIDLDGDPVGSASDPAADYAIQMWAPDASQRVRIDLGYVNLADPAPVGPTLHGSFRVV